LEADRVRGDAMGFQSGGDVLGKTLVLECCDRQIQREAGGLEIPCPPIRTQPREQTLQSMRVQSSGVARSVAIGRTHKNFVAARTSTRAKFRVGLELEDQARGVAGTQYSRTTGGATQSSGRAGVGSGGDSVS